MNESTSKVGQAIDELVENLSERPGFSGVAVASSDLGSEWANQNRKALVFVGARIEQQPMGMGQNYRMETITLSGDLWCVSQGQGEDAAQEARDGALAIEAELETYLSEQPTLDGVGLNVEMDSFELDSGPWIGPAGGHFAEITFDLILTTQIQPY